MNLGSMFPCSKSSHQQLQCILISNSHLVSSPKSVFFFFVPFLQILPPPQKSQSPNSMKMNKNHWELTMPGHGYTTMKETQFPWWRSSQTRRAHSLVISFETFYDILNLPSHLFPHWIHCRDLLILFLWHLFHLFTPLASNLTNLISCSLTN